MYVHAAANSTATASATAQQEEAPMNTAIVTTTTAPVAPINQNPKEPQQRQTAKEIIAANVKNLIEQLEAGHSDALTGYLDAMSRFHNYSFGNILEIARQKPTATRVAGLYAWNQLGRKVKKGEHGIRILAPIVGLKRKKDEEAERDITKQNTRVLVGFRNAYVFDVTQTEGAELPSMREMRGTVGENQNRLVSFIKAQGIELAFTEKIAPALGMSYGGKIAILPGQSEAEEFSTLVHELAHEMLHKAERRTTTTKVVRETEAEAIAFVIGKAVGLETGSASADYIHLYHGNASLLAESLEVIQQTSGVILAALQPPTAEQAAMPDAELAKVA
jgi:antirestriction protein ArdC